jgi:hypothetical protein
LLQIERDPDSELIFNTAMDGYAAKLWTALPAIVVSYDASQGTVTVQPAVQAQFTDPDTGATSWVSLPQLPYVPVVFMGGGPFVTTYPIQAGDESVAQIAEDTIWSAWSTPGTSGPKWRQVMTRLSTVYSVGLRIEYGPVPRSTVI